MGGRGKGGREVREVKGGNGDFTWIGFVSALHGGKGGWGPSHKIS